MQEETEKSEPTYKFESAGERKGDRIASNRSEMIQMTRIPTPEGHDPPAVYNDFLGSNQS